MSIFQKNIFLFVFISCFSLGSAQHINLKLPFESASFSSDLNQITFLWEDNLSSNWQIDLASNANFIGATSYSSTNTTFNISINTLTQQKYFWRIRSNTDTSNTRNFTVFSLNSLGSLVYHINAQTGVSNAANKVTQWNNLVNPQFNATQTNTTFQPEHIPSLVYDNDLIKFGGNDGSVSTNLTLNDFLIADTNFTFISASQQISLNSDLSYILGADNPVNGVYSGGTTSGGRNFGILSNDGGANNSIRVSGTTSLNFEIRSGYYNKLLINSDIRSVVYNGNVSQLKFNTIGLRPDVPTLNFHGYLGDILIYNEVLPDSSRLLVENYLKTKYTPYPDLGKDTIVCGPSIKIGFRPDHVYSSRIWSTGDSNVDSINITQNGTYWVRVESFGKIITDTIKITGIVPIPQISLSNDQTICFGDSIQVSYSALNGFTPTWINGQTTNTISVKDSNQFVQVTHTDINNCSASSAMYFINVDSVELQSTLGDDRNICDGGNIYVETTSNQGPFQYNWSTGDTTSFTTPTSIGIQNIFVEMTDFNSCIFKDTVQINAINLPAPNVNFSFDTVCPNSPTSFTDLSTPGGTDNIIGWKWAFINNDSLFTQNAEYAFQQGSYNVNLTVETDSGCVNTLTKQIRTHKQPTAKINTPILCAQGESEITSSSFVAIPDFLVSYNWLVDGNIFSGNTPQVIFNNEGFNDVQLIVETDKGCMDTTIKSIEVFPALLPDFAVNNVCIGDSLQFTDITPSFSIIEKEWNFGVLSNTSNEENPKFLYPTPGNYTVKLSVTNAIGCSNFIEKTIEIQDLPTASAVFENACINDVSLFIDASTVNNGFVNEMSWLINGVNFNNDSVTYIFDTITNPTITHSIIDNFGCTDDTTFQIQINALPDVDFNFNPNYGTAPIDIAFNNQSTNAINYSWDFGDNIGFSTEINPSYTYNQNGIYGIVLSATNQFNCSNTLLKQITIAPTDLDLELSNLTFTKTTLIDGSIAYAPSVLLKNVGTRIITNVDLYAAIDNETKVAETWTGSLGIGQAFLYEFTSYFVIQNNELLDYICVSGNNVNDNTENNLSNNKTCEIQKGVLQTSPLFPNPTQNITYMDVVSKNKGSLTLEVYDMLGKKMFGFNNINLDKGYNQIAIDCVTLQAGTYYVNLIYLDETYTQKLVITNQ